jgi:hypothetical protein
MKKTTWLYIAIAAGVYWYWMKKKKTGVNGASTQEAANMARQLVAETVDNTTFVPSETSFAKEYAKDQNACR